MYGCITWKNGFEAFYLYLMLYEDSYRNPCSFSYHRVYIFKLIGEWLVVVYKLDKITPFICGNSTDFVIISHFFMSFSTVAKLFVMTYFHFIKIY